ncbi:MAG: IS66 family insertion sequence element accessory protein TnpB, partial [Bacteroidales bacterium]|nr:IS66 family insertion sequence element accessory protein TnpB [Bacteroidales bacterium]
LYRRQKESGLTVKEFCANEVISPATFYNWQKKLKSKNLLPGFIPVLVNQSVCNLPDKFRSESFFPSQGYKKEEEPTLEIEFSNKTIVRLKSGIDLSLLKALIQLND